MWQVKNCEVCNNSDINLFLSIIDYGEYKVIDSNTLFSLMRCPNCCHCFSLDRLTREELKSIYHSGEYVAFQQYSNPQNNELLAKIAKIFIDDIISFVGDPVGKKLFEVGCSYGHLMDAAKQRGFTVKGLEPSLQASNYVSKKFALDVDHCTLEDLKVTGDKYDVVVSMSVFEHVYDLEKSITKIKQIMHDNSLFYIEVPTIDSIQVKLLGKTYIQSLVKKKKGLFHPVEHVRYFSINSMKRFLEKNFSEVEQVPDPRWKRHYKFRLSKALLARGLGVSPTGNIVFVVSKPK